MSDGQLSLFPERRHSHLWLTGAITPGPRMPHQARFSGVVRYPDRKGHGGRIREDVIEARSQHAGRSPVLGVDPELVLVLETSSQLDPEEVQRAGLITLELRSGTALVAFATDPDMVEFLRRNEEYRKGSPGLNEKGNERAAAYQRLFDALEHVRPVGENDVLAPELAATVEQVAPTDLLRVDIECWCGEDPDEARRRNEDVQHAVAVAGGTVLASGIRVEAGWSTVCASAPAGRVREIANLDRVRRIDAAPQPRLSYPEMRNTGPNDLPTVVPPAGDAPILAVIDSGLRSAHPLLAPAVVGVEYVGGALGDGGDETGHGTFVASLALYGSLEPLLGSKTPLQPVGKLLSIRVLDENNHFSDQSSWAQQLLDAMDLAAEAGARVINLSLGDPRSAYVPPRPTPVAALVDLFARNHPGIVVIISAGNFDDIGAHSNEELIDGRYPATLLSRSDTGILDPATAALAITVGALCPDRDQGAGMPPKADEKVIGGPGWPSPFTRVGPGPSGMVKPELTAPGGSITVDTLMKRPRLQHPLTSVVGAGAAEPGRLLAIDTGTSFAAPIASHAALRVFSRYPQLSANGARALLLLSAEPVELVVEGDGAASSQTAQRRLSGYGRVSSARAESSTDHRAVLLSESTIRVDDVHLYVVPMPSTFFESGGRSSLSMALAYDPPVRATRLDYLASRFGVAVYYGASLADVQGAYVRAEQQDELEDDADAIPASISQYQLKLQPADTSRSRGAHQFGSIHRQQKYDESRGRELIIAVRNVNRWDTAGAGQTYALAVALERDTEHADLYAELRAQLEAVVVVEVEQQIEL